MKSLMKPFSYISVPKGYECSACKATNCKLWRQYQTFADHISLLCSECAGKDQERDMSSLDEDGRVISELFMNCVGYDQIADVDKPRTDQIGSLMPAVPTEDGRTFWGYTSVPDAGCRWWRALPSRPVR